MVLKGVGFVLGIIEILWDRDVALRSLTNHVDTGTGARRMLYAVLGAEAQFERNLRRKRTVEGMHATKSRGADLVCRAFDVVPCDRMSWISCWR